MLRHPRVAVVTNIIPHYRADFYRRILDSREYECHVFCQKRSCIPGPDLEAAPFRKGVTGVDIFSFANEKIGWQTIPIASIRNKFDMCVVHGNPRLLSNVLASCIFRMRGFPVILWGQAHTAGASPMTERLRLAWWRFFPNLLVYSDHEVEYLRDRGFRDQRIVGLNNGLDQQELDRCAAKISEQELFQWRRKQGLQGKTILLLCARLRNKNRFDLVIDALPALLKVHRDLVVCVLGDGPERDALKEQARRLGVVHAVRWEGEVYDEETLAFWFKASAVLVHPGAVGLTLLHAFGYGLPVITHDNPNHQMPEVAALKPEVNGLTFRYNDVQSLVEKILYLLNSPPLRAGLSAAALRTAREEFNTSVMADRFSDMVRTAWCGTERL